MKKAERSTVTVKLRQSGLQGQSVTVRVSGRKIGGDASAQSPEFQVGQRTVLLNTGFETADIDFTPEESGRFEFTATVTYRFEPSKQTALDLVWQNPTGFLVTDYRITAETLTPQEG